MPQRWCRRDAGSSPTETLPRAGALREGAGRTAGPGRCAPGRRNRARSHGPLCRRAQAPHAGDRAGPAGTEGQHAERDGHLVCLRTANRRTPRRSSSRCTTSSRAPSAPRARRPPPMRWGGSISRPATSRRRASGTRPATRWRGASPTSPRRNWRCGSCAGCTRRAGSPRAPATRPRRVATSTPRGNWSRPRPR